MGSNRAELAKMNEGARRKGEELVYPAAESRSRPPRAHLVQVESNCGFGSFPCRIGSYTWDALHPLEARPVPVGPSPPGRVNYRDTKSGVSGKSVSIRVELGGRRFIKKK